MEPVFAVILLALLEYSVLGALVGRARMLHGVQSPATTGPAAFLGVLFVLGRVLFAREYIVDAAIRGPGA